MHKLTKKHIINKVIIKITVMNTMFILCLNLAVIDTIV